MRANEFVETKQRLDVKCWKGKHKAGTKIKGGVRVNNCVPNESALNEFASSDAGSGSGRWYTDNQMTELVGDGWWEAMDISGAGIGVPDGDLPKEYMMQTAQAWLDDQGYNVEVHNIRINDDDCDWFIAGDFHNPRFAKKSLAEELDETAAWQKSSGKNKTGGLNAKGVASYRREHPGSKLQTAVTTKPSKLKPGSKAAKRRKSFCARMGGVKGPMKKPNGKPTRKALALRKWNCESIENMEQMLAEIKKGAKDSNGFTRCWPGKHAEGTKKGRNGGQVRNCVPNESQGVAEGLPQTLRKVVPGYAKREIDKKMDAGKFGKTDADKDANFQRYKKIQDKIKEQSVAEGSLEEKWTQKYKSSINCSNPKGFSQKAHCAGKKKK